MLHVHAINDDEYAWMENETFYRRFVFCQDIFEEFEDDEAGRFEFAEVFVSGDEWVRVEDGVLMLQDDGWEEVTADFTVTRKISDSDFEFIVGWRRQLEMEAPSFRWVQRALRSAPWDAEVAEAQAIILCEILPADVVACVFKALHN